jgi:hypothetical protein
MQVEAEIAPHSLDVASMHDWTRSSLLKLSLYHKRQRGGRIFFGFKML